MRIFYCFAIAVLTLINLQAQEKASVVVINVLIDTDQKIMVEQDSVAFDEVRDAVKEIIYAQPFVPDQKLVYRVYADKKLALGVIMDVEGEMFKAMHEGVLRERYLLSTQELNPDGQDWVEKVRQLDLKPIKVN